ncbi:phage baseplate assembly protein domain-containing protein [Pseudomonas schmalbachii]|uniref:Phage baseplate assembly protein n=1 Tax=Pseudomonas schmalbachii TaxID=2816993 RepID=A0ABS3TKD9_9PSED|nr:phage baseplate assembly protein [Pseudomonas schmalbachii]MBO3274122.1 phage baseplate assembly protein [Pseudomonas schmalbachii]
MSELRRLAHAVAMSFARAVLRRSDDAGQRMQLQVEVLDKELCDGVEYMTHYGLYSRPLPGADFAVAFINGNREQGIAIASADRRYHLTLAEGEIALADDLGNLVKLGRDGVQVQAVQALNISAPTISIDGDVAFTGTITSNGKVLDDRHTHKGVTPGSGSTGVPN